MSRTISIRIEIEVPDDFGIQLDPGDQSPPVMSPESLTAPDHTSPEQVLASFEKATPNSQARRVYEALIARGWTGSVPSVRKEERATARPHYLLLTYHGRTSLYLKNKKLACAGRAVRELVGGLPGASPNAREIEFWTATEAQVAQALAAAETIRDWVDGGLHELSGEPGRAR
jgi:hypothetical protein